VLAGELDALEEEEAALSELYPQSTDPDATWAFTVRPAWATRTIRRESLGGGGCPSFVPEGHSLSPPCQTPIVRFATTESCAAAVQVMGYYFKGVCGVVGAVVSLCWILHIILYMFISPPVTPFLNDLFVQLDGVFSLFGTVAFALFCFYLLCCVMKGNMTLGLNLIVFTVPARRASESHRTGAESGTHLCASHMSRRVLCLGLRACSHAQPGFPSRGVPRLPRGSSTD
jgi:hypothetical protein